MFPWKPLTLIVWIVFCGLIDAKLKRGRYPQFNDFCSGKGVYVGIPYDCSGYVQCSSGNGIISAHWMSCPSNLYYSLKHKTCMWPEDVARPCPSVKDVIETYCPQYPKVKLVHEGNCAMYYDCRDFGNRKQPYLKECPYPQLFNKETLTCDDYKYVDCEGRYRPVTACDYKLNQCVGPNCPSCESQQPGCEGQANGPAPFPGRLLTEYYLICKNNKTIATKSCKKDRIYDPIVNKCTRDLDPMALNVYCASNIDARIGHPKICSRYYDCKLTNPRENFNRYENECRYPLLYSERYQKCLDFADVQCGSKIEPKSPCEYVENQCFGPNCPNCNSLHPSCVSLADGPNPYPGIPNKYIICRLGRTVETRECAAGDVYSANLRGCPSPGAGSGGVQPIRRPVRPPVDPPGVPGPGPTPPPSGPCANDPFGIIPDQSNCARYYNCSQRYQIPGLDPFMSECPYPQLFDINTKGCNDFPAVTCGNRYEPMAPCDYITSSTNCEGESCQIPCAERSPSCVSKPDGNNTFPGRDLTPFYMTCLRSRTLSVGICKYGVYDPTKKYCTTDLDPYSVQVFCKDKPNVKFPHIANCARYYDCSAITVDPVFGKFQRECTHPTMFNIDLLKCVPPGQADCQWRYQPQDPCGFVKATKHRNKNERCDAYQRNCVPCLDTNTICIGVKEGNVAIELNRHEYSECQLGRYVKIGNCHPSIYNQAGDHDGPPCIDESLVDRKCQGLRDGKYPMQNDKYHYRVCKGGKFIQKGDCRRMIFDSKDSKCVKPPFLCERLRDGNYSHEDGYQYHVCLNGRYETTKTCKPYPFDLYNGACYKGVCIEESGSDIHLYECDKVNKERFSRVKSCGLKIHKNDICDMSLPSFCSTRSNGYHKDQNIPVYTLCQDRYPRRKIMCPAPVFSNGVCHDGYEPSDPVAFCEMNPTAVMLHPGSCAGYVDCRKRNTLLGNYQEECTYPDLFDSFNNSCKTYREVKCGNRPEPKAPCDYKKQSLCPAGTQCAPCAENNPSCVGKRDGPQATPNKPEYFMVCQDERTISVTPCPATAPTFNPRTGSCSVTLNSLNPGPYCEANPTAIEAHPENCAQFIDCRQKNTVLGGYRQECPYPQLVLSTGNTGASCMEFTAVDCGLRPEPKNPCDYERNLICQDPKNCIPCNERLPSCFGRQDGNHPFPGQPRKYIRCFKDRTTEINTCDLGQFDPLTRKCTVTFDPASPKAYCNLNPRVRMTDQTNCARYYDCSKPNGFVSPYREECSYPQLYSETKKSCLVFSDVQCSGRYIPKDPCEYKQNQCFEPSGEPAKNCEPCKDRIPSCVGMPDGNQTYPGRPNSQFFITCYNERTILVRTCENGIYDDTIKKCASTLDPSNPQLYCSIFPMAKVPNPNICSQYFDCSRPEGQFGAYLFECQYPELFAETGGACEIFSRVNCGGRYVPQSPCEYQQNQCSPTSGAQCEPCEQRLPSCVGKPPGNNTITGRELTADYVVCYSNRTVSVETCPYGYFSPTDRSCKSTLGPATIRQFCVDNPGTIRANPVNCAQYFDCGANSIKARTFLRECPYPMLFSTVSKTCLNYTSVVCGSRTEYTTPCDYLQNRCNPALKNCRPCKNRYVSCKGLVDGNHPDPRKTMSPEYVRCNRERTVGEHKCSSGLFDPGTRTCTLDITEEMIRRHCELYPNTIHAHRRQCAQYFDCGPTIGGSYLRECKYPQLFDKNTKTCLNFTDVDCGTRIEPEAPCDYLQNHCPPTDKECVPCEDRLPSCKRQGDGNNVYPGRPVSEYYINCFKSRTVSVEACQVSLYDSAKRKCSTRINPGVLRKFCRANPAMIIPDPANCARYYNCSDEAVVQGLPGPYIQECKYPRLFHGPSVGCQLFTMVKCQTGRYVPKTPCEYVENQCFNSTCEPCETRFPSCVGKVDGSNEFPGRENTEFYIVCYRERTVAIVSCTIGLYSHGDRACVGTQKNSTAPDPR